MEHAEKERLIRSISWGHHYVNSFVLYPPSLEDKSLASIVYKNEYEKAISNGMMSESDLLYNMINIDKWSIEKEKQIKEIKDDIYKITKGLLSLFFNKSRMDQAKKTLRSAEKALLELIYSRNDLLSCSANNYAVLKEQRFIISRITRDTDNNKVWKNISDFNNSKDLNLIDTLCNEFFNKSIISMIDMREIARTSPWRNMWIASKNMGNLFGIPVSQFSDNQLNLVSWSQTYDIVYESYERPCKEIIEDNDLLDSWLILQSEKIDSKSNQDLVGKNSNKSGKNETFVFSDQRGAKDVYNANDPLSRAKILARQKTMTNQGATREQDMPDSQEIIRIEAAKNFKDKIRRK